MNRHACAFFTVLIALAAPGWAQDPPESFNARDGVAIKGYDPVAYFTLDAAVPGDPSIATEHGGVVYQFSTEEHLELFVADPAQYVPAYGGWCAWAVSRNSLADIDPRAYTIHEGRLYLNYSHILNTRFRLGLGSNIERAEAHWPELARQAASR
ncbi:MAG TPA: YHS domain-containing (seleno)protein [Spirochaetia bacterium]|nr:YHS domain-containing (seleno)protein [Spirochaetia bacterium]